MPEQQLSFRDAINQAMREEMERDATVFLMGEDVGKSGGIFKCSVGLLDALAPSGCSTPLSPRPGTSA